MTQEEIVKELEAMIEDLRETAISKTIQSTNLSNQFNIGQCNGYATSYSVFAGKIQQLLTKINQK